MGKHRTHSEWLHLVQKYYASNIPLEQFCGMNNINPNTFCQYKRSLRPLMEEEEELLSPFALVKRDEVDEEDNVFFPPENHQVLNIQAGALQLSLPASTSPQWLAMLIKEVIK